MGDSATTLSIILSAKDNASAIFGAISDKLKGMGLVGSDAAKQVESLGTSTDTTATKLKTGLVVGAAAVTVGILAVGAASLKTAANFQTMTTTLVTSAGESADALKGVQNGIIQVSDTTGTSVDSLSKAMYTIESAGQHGANGLLVLKAAAQGAKAENADVQVVADAVSSALQDYHQPASAAADITSKLITAVSTGKTTFQDLAGSLHSVLPIASAVGISLSDVTAAIASMTVHGMSADQASQNLAEAIRTLQSPSQSASQYLASIGITASDLTTQLADPKVGITGALQQISDAIMQHMGPDGKVLIDSFNQSKSAAADASAMISKMSPQLQTLAKQYLAGSISATDWRTDTRDLGASQANLANQFASVANQANGFNNLLKSGSPTALSYSQALQKATGNATTMNVALMLTGENTDYVNNAVKKVTDATADAAGNVKGWSEIQGTMNVKLQEAKNTISNTGIAIGTALLPAATKLLDIVNKLLIPIATFAENHSKLTVIVLSSIGAFSALLAILLTTEAVIGKITGSIWLQAIATRAVTIATGAWSAIQAALDIELDANPLGAIIIAIIALVAAVIAVITHWQQLSDFFKKLWIDIDAFFGSGIVTLFTRLDPFVRIPEAIIDNWQGFIDFFKTAWSDPALAFQEFVNKIEDTWNRLVKDAEFWIPVLINKFVSGLADADTIAHRVGGDLYFYTKKGFEDALSDADTWAKDLAKVMIQGFVVEAVTIEKAGNDMYNEVKKGWDKGVSLASGWGQDLMTAIGKGIKAPNANAAGAGHTNMIFEALGINSSKGLKGAATGAAKNLISYDIGSLVDWKRSAVSIYQNAFNTGKTMFGDIEAGFKHDAKSASNWVESVVKSLKNGFSGKELEQDGKDIVKSILKGMKDAWKDIKTFFKDLPDLLKPDAKKSGEDIADHHVEGMKSSFTDVGKMNKLGEAILKGIGIAIAAVIGAIVLLAISIAIAMINGFISAFKDEVKAIITALQWVISQLLGFFVGAPSWLYQAGKDIISGLINGIEDGIKGIGSVIGKIGNDIGGGVKSALHAAHIPGFATGVQNFRGGLAVVGENGPELVALPSGSNVYPAGQTQAMMSGGTVSASGTAAGTTQHVTINVNVGAYAGQPGEIDKLGQVMWQSFQRIARQHGLANALPNIGVRPS